MIDESTPVLRGVKIWRAERLPAHPAAQIARRTVRSEIVCVRYWLKADIPIQPASNARSPASPNEVPLAAGRSRPTESFHHFLCSVGEALGFPDTLLRDFYSAFEERRPEKNIASGADRNTENVVDVRRPLSGNVRDRTAVDVREF